MRVARHVRRREPAGGRAAAEEVELVAARAVGDEVDRGEGGGVGPDAAVVHALLVPQGAQHAAVGVVAEGAEVADPRALAGRGDREIGAVAAEALQVEAAAALAGLVELDHGLAVGEDVEGGGHVSGGRTRDARSCHPAADRRAAAWRRGRRRRVGRRPPRFRYATSPRRAKAGPVLALGQASCASCSFPTSTTPCRSSTGWFDRHLSSTSWFLPATSSTSARPSRSTRNRSSSCAISRCCRRPARSSSARAITT